MSKIGKIRKQLKERGFTQQICPNCDSKAMRVFRKFNEDETEVTLRIFCGNCLTCLH